jgi:hypothetical protein
MRVVGHRLVLLAAMALAAVTAAAAQAQQEPGDGSDPPTRTARLSDIEGAVSVQPAGLDDWTLATINRPLTSGDALWTDRGSRALIDLGVALVNLADDSSVTLLNLGDEAVQLQLSAGSIIVAMRDTDPVTSFEIDAPSASVSLMRPGSYRIGVDSAGNTTVATRDGQSQVVTRAGNLVILRGGQAAQFGANGDFDVATLAAPDDFERWSARHAQRWTSDQGVSRYVSSDVVGAEDLDGNGEWVQEPDYGYTWYPTAVAVDWAPYRDGCWLWVAPWGWTWVDNARWGYAPFHYGRWTYLRQRWGWVPAPPGSRAVYAPALVAWIGAAGGVGWLPLAPGEIYLPGYRVSARYLRNVNVSNTAIINSTYITSVDQNPALQYRYANRDAPRALSVVSQRGFISGKPIAAQLIAPPAQWQGLDATSRPPSIAPARQSVLGPAVQSPARHPPVAIANRAVVARRTPPPAPAPFERQLNAMRANGGRPLPPAQLQQLRDTDHPRPIILVAPPSRSAPTQTPADAPMPSVRATPARPLIPDRHVMPVTPALSSSAPAQPLPVPSRQALPQEFERASPPAVREVAPPSPPPPPPPAQSPTHAEPSSRGKSAPQVVRPDLR